MGRPVTLIGSESHSPLTWVQNVQYDFADRMSSLQYLVSPTSSGYTTEAKGFNATGQLTSIGWTGSASPVTGTLQYGYSATQDNGQITQMVDSISGETIVYQYDSLKRLTSAASVPNTGSPVAAWTQTFQYDGFGNQTAQVLNGTTTAIPVNAATNQLSSASYDSNGIMTSGVGATFTFDVGNRILSAAEISGGVGVLRLCSGQQADLQKADERCGRVYILWGAWRKAWGLQPDGWDDVGAADQCAVWRKADLRE